MRNVYSVCFCVIADTVELGTLITLDNLMISSAFEKMENFIRTHVLYNFDLHLCGNAYDYIHQILR